MRRIVSKLLVITLMISSLSVTAFAEEDINPDIVVFVSEVTQLSNKAEFVEMLGLLRSVDDYDGFLTTYTAMYNSLLPGQQDRVDSFGATITAAGNFGRYFMNEEFSMANLEAYLGLDDGDMSAEDVKNFYAALERRETEFLEAVGVINHDQMKNGFDRMDKIFDFVKDVEGNTAINTDFLDATVLYGTLSMNRVLAEDILSLTDKYLVDDIESEEPVLDGFEQLVNYYNAQGSGDRTVIWNYLDSYGYINYTPSSSNSNNNNSSASSSTPSSTTEDIVDEDIVEFLDVEPVPQASFLFNDLFRYSWAQTAIRQLYIADVINGKGDGIFDPSGFITRAEFAAMLSRMFEANAPISYKPTFTDVSFGDWFVDYVEGAYLAGYIKGIGNNEYAPLTSIDREQIATMISRVLVDAGYDTPAEEAYDEILSVFVDADQVSEWAKPGCAMAVKYGIITGYEKDGKTYFGFKEKASRAEVSVMLYRLVEEGLINDTDVQLFGSDGDAPVQ